MIFIMDTLTVYSIIVKHLWLKTRFIVIITKEFHDSLIGRPPPPISLNTNINNYKTMNDVFDKFMEQSGSLPNNDLPFCALIDIRVNQV